MALHVLPPEVAAKIAAGEVIERPASAVKELVENALDAGATAVAVDIVAGGRRLIRVRDNGCGLDAAAVPLAFERYATSKIASEEDLLHITTLGFRGEAMPSIASVAEVIFLSRPPDALGGYYVRFRDGRPQNQGPQGAPEGTTVTVRDLFLDFPARRRFLRSDTTEASHCVTVVTHYALARPDVRFTMTVDGKEVLQTPGSGGLRAAAAAVLGADAAAGLLEITPLEQETQDPEAYQELRVTGLLSPPGLTRSSRAQQSIFVNGRWVQHRGLAHGIEEAYQGAIMVGRHPIAIVHIAIPPQEVDVNIHPRKTEVRFRHEGEVYAAVHRAVRQTIAAGRPAKELPSARPAPTGGGYPPPSFFQGALLTPASTPSSGSAPRDGSGERHPWPLLRVIGQMSTTYIIAEGPDGMYLVDQHAAHERIVYERVAREAQQKGWNSQGLIEPYLMTLPPESLLLLLQEQDQLARYGFGLEPFGERQLLVRALPQGLRAEEASTVVTELLESLQAGQERSARIVATVACHSAVRAGDVLAAEEIRALLRDLEQCQQPQTCPHGRPTMLHVSAAHLEREFGRRG